MGYSVDCGNCRETILNGDGLNCLVHDLELDKQLKQLKSKRKRINKTKIKRGSKKS